jgi:coproporphyrinogen III oxidase-like Fe-S oxidoreductase
MGLLFARPGCQYAIERDTFRLFPIRGFGPGSWSQEGTSQVWDPSRLQSYLRDPLKRWKRECSIDYYTMRVLMFPQGLVFKEFEELFGLKWSPEILGDDMRKSLDSWDKKGLVERDGSGIRFKKETAATSSIYLAEFHTQSLYCPGDKPPFSYNTQPRSQ